MRALLRLILGVAMLAGSMNRCRAADEPPYMLGAVRSADGSLFAVDRTLPGVWLSKDGKLSEFFHGSKKFRTPLNAARCIAFDRDGKVLVGDSSTREVYRFNEPGQPSPLTKGGIGIPMAIAVDAEGTLFVADLELHRIFKVPAAGGDAKEFVAISAPRGVAFDAEGNLIVLSTTKDQIHKVTKDGKISLVTADRPFNFPHNVVVAGDGNYYVTDGYEKCVWKVTPDGKPVKFVESKEFMNPVGLSVSGDKLLITDPRANAVFECDLMGKLTKLDLGKK